MLHPAFLEDVSIPSPEPRFPRRTAENARTATAVPAAPPGERERFIGSYHYLCRRGARKFSRSGIESADLEQVAAIGLIKAADRYDVAARTPFEAFAWIMIVGELMHYVRDHERLVRVPRRLLALERRYVATTESLASSLGRSPNDREIAEAMGIFSNTIVELRCMRETKQLICVDDPNITGMRERLFEPEGGIALEDRMLLEAALASLTRLERRVVVSLYLLEMTQLELARDLGISPKRVSRLHGNALARMQRACGGAS
ncbi:MAG: sigma-70 family RNA polymerase sigma factor [Candidatus Baltobacteraceae bacterium]